MIITDGDCDLRVKKAKREKCTEFLGLPLDIHNNHSLTFAVAHRTIWTADAHRMAAVTAYKVRGSH